MYYLINNKLEESSRDEIFSTEYQYIAILNTKEWMEDKNMFKMGIDFEPQTTNIHVTKAEENYDSITGTFFIPVRDNIQEDEFKFAFALDEKGIVFIDDGTQSRKFVRKIRSRKKWRLPSLERFIYEFLNQIIRHDFRLMESYEYELNDMENAILQDEDDVSTQRLNEIRADIRDLRNHYEQLLDLSEVFEENENRFFKEENLRYFRLFSNRVERLRDTSTAIRDYTMQVRDLYKMQLDIKQNHIMTLLTIITTTFTPLTFIVGWYGMNFKYMPELEYTWTYPMILLLCIVVTTTSLLYFKRKKWI
ncbi:MAG: magnesium transporter CorA [Methanosphaera sp. rholeuAM74]|nr:MAG: magnesium transporter CorA [Methanosphaera sp. rholeuAM74]